MIHVLKCIIYFLIFHESNLKRFYVKRSNIEIF